METIKISKDNYLSDGDKYYKVQILNAPKTKKAFFKFMDNLRDTLLGNDLSKFKIITDSEILEKVIPSAICMTLPELKVIVEKEENLLIINTDFSPSLLRLMLDLDKDNYLIQFMCDMEKLKSNIYF